MLYAPFLKKYHGTPVWPSVRWESRGRGLDLSEAGSGSNVHPAEVCGIIKILTQFPEKDTAEIDNIPGCAFEL